MFYYSLPNENIKMMTSRIVYKENLFQSHLLVIFKQYWHHAQDTTHQNRCNYDSHPQMARPTIRCVTFAVWYTPDQTKWTKKKLKSTEHVTKNTKFLMLQAIGLHHSAFECSQSSDIDLNTSCDTAV